MWTYFALRRQGRSCEQDGTAQLKRTAGVSCRHRMEYETRNWLDTKLILNVEHNMMNVCKSEWMNVREATCARLTISRCVLEDNVETRRKTDAVLVSGDQHCCYEDSSPGHSSLTLSKWALVIWRSVIRDHPRRRSSEIIRDQWVSKHRSLEVGQSRLPKWNN